MGAHRSPAELPNIGAEVASIGDALTSLMEIEPGIAVLFADQPQVDFDLIPFQVLHSDGTVGRRSAGR